MSNTSELEKKIEKLERILENLARESKRESAVQQPAEQAAVETIVPMQSTPIEQRAAHKITQPSPMPTIPQSVPIYVSGWHEPEKGFRWAGKDATNARVDFPVGEGRYTLCIDAFVPAQIANKPIKILVNGAQIAQIAPPEGRLKKTIDVPQIATGKISIEFVTGFWKPKDHGMNDPRTLSLAFKNIELAEI